MKTINVFLLLIASLFIISCSDSDDNHISNPFDDGVYILNEGDFSGDPSANLSFLTSTADTLQFRVFEASNPGQSLGQTGVHGIIEDDILYVVSKYEGDGAQLISVDSETMLELQTLNAGDFTIGTARYFEPSSDEFGYLATSTGLFQVDLRSLAVTKQIDVAGEQCGNVISEDGYLFVTKMDHVLVINELDLTLTKTVEFDGAFGGMVETDDKICFIAGTNLYEIDEDDLSVTETSIGSVAVSSSYSAGWDGSPYFQHVGSLAYSSDVNKLYYSTTVKQGWNDLRDVYSIDLSTKSVSEVRLLSDDNRTLYGAGIGVNSDTGSLLLNTIVVGDYVANALYEIDLISNEVVKTIEYDGPVYPSSFVFED